MKKLSLVMLAWGLSIAAQAGLINGTLTETQFADSARTEANSATSNLDTLQATNPDHLITESMVWDGGWVPTDGPAWGAVTTLEAVRDAGPEWWAYNQNTTIGVDGIGDGYIDFRWKDEYDASPAYTGRDLDRIDILVGAAGIYSDRVNYTFRIEALSHDWQTWTPITDGKHVGGSNILGIGTLISITDIGIRNIRGIRVTADGGWQPGANGDFWGATEVMEMDVYLVPEPATLGLVGIAGAGMLFFRRKFMI